MPINVVTLDVLNEATDWLDASEALSGSVAYQLTDIGTLTVTFEAKRIGVADGKEVAVQATNMNTGTAATTATANGIYVINVPAGVLTRVKLTALTGGSVNVWASPSLG